MTAHASPARRALIIVDVQNDFMTGGALAVSQPAPEAIVPLINLLARSARYVKVVLTQDFHPANHCSFADNLGVPPFTLTRTPAGREQMAWPRHCVQGTPGAQFHPTLSVPGDNTIVTKGTSPDFDSYSGFADDGGRATQMREILDSARISDVDVVGIATDYCVKATALHAAQAGYKTRVILPACAGVAPETIRAAIASLRAARVEVLLRMP